MDIINFDTHIDLAKKSAKEAGKLLQENRNQLNKSLASSKKDTKLLADLKAEDLIEKTKVNLENLKQISSIAPIQEILPQLAESKNGLAVVNEKNKKLGIITPQGVIKVMASAGSKKQKLNNETNT